MDLISHLPEILVAVAVALFIHLWRVGRSKENKKQKSANFNPPVPKIPGSLPLIGHLHLLGGNQTLSRKLASFSEKYGTVFTIRLGANDAVVVSDYEGMKECFTTNDRILSFRPDSSQAKILGYNYAAFGFASYGNYWRDIKKLLMNQLLSVQRIKALRNVQISEVESLMKNLYKISKLGKPINMSSSLQHYVLNIITRMVAGKRYFNDKNEEDVSGGRPIGQVMKEFMLVTGTLVPSDLIPVLGWFGFKGVVNAMKRVSKELDVIMESWIDDHKKKEIANGGKISSDSDLIDVMLHEIKDDVAYGHKRETIAKATAMSLIVAGSDTTSITLSWILSNLVNHKRVMKLAQEEIDEKVGRDRWVDDSDIENLSYLGAVIKETLRMYPPGPLSVPREASEDITIKGYHVPKGTRFFANFWKLHRDPKVWSDPNDYKPERFLTENANLEIFGQQFEYLPFGSGRRGCPGINFGMQVTKLTLARLLQGFNWGTEGDKPVDMTEGMGIALPKANPLEVMLTPRLAPQLY
ncbi:Cytochrome P450 CYP82J17 [Linum grandiflorum]